MGQAQAGKQVLGNRGGGGSGLGGPQALGSPLPGVGPIPDLSTASTTVSDGDQDDDKIPVVFTWTQGGQQVFLAASFNGWREQIPMVRSGNEFHVVQDLPRGVHQYKFIVDDHWRFAPDQAKTQDNSGNMNNVLDISNYQKFQVGMMDDTEPHQHQRFSQQIPDPNDYTVDAPVIPMVLHKSPFNAVPPRPHITGTQPLSIPPHSLCDHIYLQERNVDDPSPATTMAVTHRYGQKYSTIIFATRSPCAGDVGPSTNWLKAAVKRVPA